MDGTDAPMSSFATIAKLKMCNPFKSRMRATPRCESNHRSTSVPSPTTPFDAERSPTTPVQNLPTEIVLDILDHLLPAVYDRAARFRQEPRALYKELARTPDTLEVLKVTQSTLRSAALLCRAWYSAANGLLYAHPFLFSSKSVDLFSRTLRSSADLRDFPQKVWVFSDEGGKGPGLPAVKRKNSGRGQEDFMHTLRSLTSLQSVTVCNHGLTVKEQLSFPIDNILVYTLPSSPKSKSSTIPGATLHGPSVFNAPWNRHAKPNNFIPADLEYLCLRDIEHSPAEVKCAPYLPTLPRLRTLKLAMYSHNETPFVSSGTVPALRNLELYRDIFDSTQRELMRVVAVDEACLPSLERLFLVGRASESVLFRNWAQNSELFAELRHLAIGLLRLDEHALIAEWHLPRHLETLEVVVWHKPMVKAASPHAEEAEAELEKMGDADGVLKALHACLHRNRQSKSFKTLVIRATDTLPRALFSVALKELRGLCDSHDFEFQLHEGDIQGWIETRLSEAAA